MPNRDDKPKQLGLFRLLVAHPNAANILMFIMLFTGALSSQKLNVQFFPTVDIPVIVVNTTWSGASAEDMDANIVSAVEPEVRFLNGVNKASATSREGSSTIVLEYDASADMQRALSEVESAVSQVSTLPKDADKPTIFRADFNDQVVSLKIAGPFPEHTLKAYAKLVRDDLLANGVDRVDLVGVRGEEIWIETTGAKLRQINLTLTDIAKRVSDSSQNQPLGVVGSDAERLLRSEGRADYGADFRAINVKSLPSGQRIQLSDVAVIRDVFAESDSEGFADNQRAVRLIVHRSPSSNMIAVSQLVEQRVDALRSSLPQTLSIERFNVRANLVVQRISMLTRNAGQGVVLVVILLFCFLTWRIAGWVAAGIATAVLGAFSIMLIAGESINMISLFAFLLMIGIVVDDAIVVGEHAVTLHEQGLPPDEAAVQAAKRMFGPVMASSLTTICAFLPIFLVRDVIGELMHTLSVIVIIIVLASLIECFLILPSHARHSLAAMEKRRKTRSKPNKFALLFQRFRHGPFRRFVAFSYDRRYLTLCAMIALLVIVAGLIAGGRVSFRFFPSPESETINAQLTFAPGTPREQTKDGLTQLHQSLLNTENTLSKGKGGLVNTSFGLVGDGGDNFASLFVELTPSETRTVRTRQFIATWRKLAPVPPGLQRTVIKAQRGGPPGSDVAVRLQDAPPDQLKAASRDLRQALTQFPGVNDVTDDMPFGKRELILSVTPYGAALGFTTAVISSQLRSSYEGAVSHRFARGDEEITVRIRLNEEERAFDPQNIRLRSPRGQEVPLSEIVSFKERTGFSVIRRYNGSRTVSVSASADGETSGEDLAPILTSSVLPPIAREHGVSFSLGGRAEEQGAAFVDLGGGLLAALVMIYVILAWALASYSQPIAVMAVIPFGLIGAVLGHMVMGYPLTILTMIALLGLTGILVNDSIILVSEINLIRKKPHASLRHAVIVGSGNRLRAVILTSLTTILGLTPLLFEQSLQAQFLKPMAITLSWGVGFATILVLALVPCLLGVINDFKHAARFLIGVKKPTPQPLAQPPTSSHAQIHNP